MVLSELIVSFKASGMHNDCSTLLLAKLLDDSLVLGVADGGLKKYCDVEEGKAKGEGSVLLKVLEAELGGSVEAAELGPLAMLDKSSGGGGAIFGFGSSVVFCCCCFVSSG